MRFGETEAVRSRLGINAAGKKHDSLPGKRRQVAVSPVQPATCIVSRTSDSAGGGRLWDSLKSTLLRLAMSVPHPTPLTQGV